MENEKDIELQNQEQDTVNNDNKKENSTEDKDNPQYRGKVLMQHALEELDKGNIEEFETDRALANKYFDEMNAEEEEMDALYTENRNFGIIYQVIESNVHNLLESKEGVKSLKKIVKAIKGNKILHEQFKVYNNLQPTKRVENTIDYINEAISMTPKFDKKKVKESNEKLIKLIKSEHLDEMVDIDDDKLDLFESIEYVTMNKKTLDNIDEYINAKNVIKESIEKLPIVESKGGMTIEEYSNEINKIAENVGTELNSAELKLIKEVSNGNAEEYFNECKENTLTKLDGMMLNEKDMETKSRLSQIYEKISQKNYNKENAIVDISEMIEIQNTIEE